MNANAKPVILLAFANDRGENGQYLRNLPQEQRLIRQALDAAEKAGLCELVERPNVILSDLVSVLQDEQYRDRIAIFHFGGHANSYQLLLENQEGNPQHAQSKSLVDLLSRRNGLKLVFLNGCSTEAQAIELTKKGISLAIGTSQAIKDDIATQLAERFYLGLARGLAIEQAWRDAQAELEGQLSDASYRGFYQEAISVNQVPWRLHEKEGATHALSWNLPQAANDPLFGLPEIPQKYYLKLPTKPFVHLKHFEQTDAAIFFGRGKEIRELYNKVHGPHSLILFYGQTGVGKSSVLDAGLLPRLEESHVLVYKRRDPDLGLSGSLESELQKSLTAAGLEPENDLVVVWGKLEAHYQKPLLIILDQVEELFTKARVKGAKDELSHFIGILISLFEHNQAHLKGKLLLSYRKEYNPEIKAAIEEANLAYTYSFLQPLSKTGIMEAIEGITKHPLTQDKYKLSIEDHDSSHLTQIIADDLMEDQESAISPVLQILLTKLWEAATKNTPEHPHFSILLYQSLKKRGILLADFFNEQMEELEKAHPEAVQSGLIIDLLNFHTTTLGTAASHSLADIQARYSHQQDRIPDLLQSCEDRYLIYSNQKTYALSHDTLAPIVQQVHKESDKAGQRALRILESKTISGYESQANMLEEIDLGTVEAGRNGMRGWTKEEESLIEKSRIEREKRLKQRKRRLQFAIAAGSAILIFGFAAILFFRQSIQNKKDSKAYYLSGLAERIRPQNPTHALRLAVTAYAIDSVNPQEVVIQTLSNIYHQNYYDSVIYIATDMKHEGTVYGAVFSKEEDKILSWSGSSLGAGSGQAKLWDLKGNLLSNMQHESWVYGAVFSKSEDKILSWSGNSLETGPGHIKLWDLKGNLLSDMQHESWVRGAIFSKSEDKILSYAEDGHVKLWDLKGNLLSDMQHESKVWGAIFSKSEDKILSWSGSSNGTGLGHAKLWDLKGNLLSDMQHESKVWGAIFSKSENKILSWSGNPLRDGPGHVKLWDLKGNLLVDMKHEASVWGAVFTKEEDKILSWSGNPLRDGPGHVKLWDLKGSLLADLQHEGSVSGAVFAEEEDKILSWSGSFRGDGTGQVRLWDIRGNLLADMQHKNRVWGAVFSKKEGKILSWSGSFRGDGIGQVRLWDTKGNLLADMQHGSRVWGANFAKEEDKILSWSGTSNGTGPGHVRLWNTKGNLLADMQHTGGVKGAVFTKKEDKILSWSGTSNGTGSGYVKLWDLKGNLLSGMQHEKSVRGAVFAKEEGKILSWSGSPLGNGPGHVKLWNLKGRLLSDMQHESRVWGAVFAKEEDKILSWSGNPLRDGPGHVKIWDLKGNLLVDMKHEASARGAVFAKEEDKILSWSGNPLRDGPGHVKIWDLKGNLLSDMQHESTVWGATFSKSEDKILSWSEGSFLRNRRNRTGHIKLWNTKGNLLADMQHAGRIKSAIFTKKEDKILSYAEDRHVKLWDIKGNLLADMQHESTVWGAVFTKQEDKILSYAEDRHVKLWDIKGNLLADMQHQSRVWGAVFAEKEDKILSYAEDGHVKLWDFKGNLLVDMQHAGRVKSAVFTKREDKILSYAEDGHVKLWDIKGKLLADMQHESRVWSAVFSKEEDKILSYTEDGHVKLWDLNENLLADMQHQGRVRGALFSKDEEQILSWSENGQLILWKTPNALFRDLRKLPFARLSKADSVQYNLND